jgi:ADP-heptose:LPS heptosyltransferase
LKKIIIARTDSIGDVILTLPLLEILKKKFSKIEILFLGRNYTREIVALNKNVTQFISYDEIENLSEKEQIKYLRSLEADAIVHVFPVKSIVKLAKKAKIPSRVATGRRFYTFFNANKRVFFSRRKSDLHEALLNLKLLEAFGIYDQYRSDELFMFYGFDKKRIGDNQFNTKLSSDKFNLILHPKSKGSAREWPLEKYTELIKLLPQDKFKVFITGTHAEGDQIRTFLDENKEKVTDLTGKMSLKELVEFIYASSGLLACSTGPLHLAAMLKKHALGIYAPMRPIHPGRWAPIGLKAEYIVKDKECNDCEKTNLCHCINDISPQEVAERILDWI